VPAGSLASERTLVHRVLRVSERRHDILGVWERDPRRPIRLTGEHELERMMNCDDR
jgi:hypothetical protein